MTPTLERFHNDPGFREEILRRARHQRATFVHDAMARLATRIKWALQSVGSPHVPGRPAQG